MSPTVTIVDYGLGNLHSVANALRHLGLDVNFAEDGDSVSRASFLILPGVGAFGDGMAGLRSRGQVEAIRRYVARDQGPLLGICLGAQLLLSESEEFGVNEGLGVIPGRVVPIPANGQKIPHIGWKPLRLQVGATDHPVIPEGAWAYFVHSFHALPDDPSDLVATAPFGNDQITAVIGRQRVLGCQFHPEKSGAAGLKMLKSFLNS